MEYNGILLFILQNGSIWKLNLNSYTKELQIQPTDN